MNSSKKSQYFRFMHSKKKKKLEPGEKLDTPASVKMKNTTKVGQKTISAFFAPKVASSTTEKPRPSFKVADEGLKRKLDHFKSDVPTSSYETIRQCNKKSKVDSQEVQETLDASGSAKKKLTPLEQQVKAIKEKHSDTLIMVEVGYRYRFFGQDAEIAAKVLDIVAHPDNVGSGQLGMTASVPTFNGPMNYVRKLVLEGEKVGIVSQTESAAEKAVNQTMNSGPFSRQLSERYTASTFLEELYDERNRTFHIMSISNSSSVLQLTPILGKLVLHKTTAKGLKDILNAMEPFEIVIGDECDIVQDFVHDQRHFRNNPVRLETIKTTPPVDLETLVFDESKSNKGLMQIWPTLNPDDISAFQMMYAYLKQFGLEKLIFNSTFDIKDLTSNFSVSSNVMRLPSMTVESLELHLLAKILNVAKTRPGKRLFRNWLLSPLTVQADIECRLDAIEYLLSNNETCILLKNLLSKYPFDFEMSLTSAIHQRIPRQKFILCLNTLNSIAAGLASISLSQHSWPSVLKNLIDDLIENFASVSKELLIPLLKSDIVETEATEKLQQQIKELENELENHKQYICKTLGVLKFEYSTVSGLEYLIEIRNGVVTAPSSWTKVNGTQRFGRYRTPEIIKILPQLQWLNERLDIEAKKAWLQYLQDQIPKLKLLLRLIKSWASLDCIVAMTSVAQRSGFCRPSFNADGKFEVKDSRNIVVEEAITSTPGCHLVANDVNLQAGDALVLTGPNMGGKSCYVRQVGILAIMAQMGSYVPADSANMPIFDGLYVRMGAKDELAKGKSTLYVELEEASLILNTATEKSLVLLDELGRGTATHDGTAIAKSVLGYLVYNVKCTTLFVTHFRCLTSVLGSNVRAGTMGYIHDNDDILFLYKIGQGGASNSFGINVGKMANLPQQILQRAKEMADLYEILQNESLTK